MKKSTAIKENLAFAAKVLKANLSGARYPLSVTYITTYRCNYSCSYCDVWRMKEREMTAPEAFSMIDEFSSLGMRRLSFNGGEPLTRPDIGDMVDYSRKKGVFTTMFSNGSLVKRNIKKIQNLDVLAVSLDGTKEVHERQRKGSVYEEVIEGIRAAKEAGINVWTNTVITKDTASCIDALAGVCSGLGVKMIFQPVLLYAHSSAKEEIEPLKAELAQYRKVVERVKKLKREGAPIMHSEEYLDHIMTPVWSLNRRKCWAGRLYCAVTPSGRVAPCYPLFNSGTWPSGVESGFGKAFDSLGRFSCTGCYCALVESDFLYSLKPGPVLNLLNSIEAL